VLGIVITGNGRGFCSGLDAATLAEVTATPAAQRPADPDALPGIFSYLLEVPKPIIAAVNGVAAGGGLIPEAAHRYGLVEHVTPPERLLETACDYVRRLAETSAPAAIAETKRLVYRHLGTGYLEALREADASQRRFVAAPDAREGAMALLEKRAPRFSRLGDEA
jgi:enoyl-CoA hydratase/carnithine racemase